MRPCWPADKLHYLRPSPASRQELARAPGLNENPMADCRPDTRRQARSSLGVLIIALLLGGCSGGILDPKGPVGSAQRLILFDALAIMLAVVVPVIVAILAFAWWYRASNSKARYLGDWAYSGRIEFVVWAIPALVIMFLGGIAWISSHDLDPARPLPSKDKPLEVQVVSLDWKWLFIYPEQGVASVNQLVVPAGVPVHFSLTSASVMNAFFVPQLGTMIYTMNGMTTQLNLQADQPGVFHGLSSQYSGDGFSGMAFEVRAVSSGDFDALDCRGAPRRCGARCPKLRRARPAEHRTWRPSPIGPSGPNCSTRS